MLVTIIYSKYIKKNFINYNLIIFLIFIINLITFFILPFKKHLITSILLIGSLIDIKERIIPNLLVVILILISIPNLSFSLDIDSIFVLLFLILIFVISYLDKGIGMGDTKLLFSLFLNMSANSFIRFLFILFFLIFIFSLFLLIKYRKKSITIPMVPFILIAYLLV